MSHASDRGYIAICVDTAVGLYQEYIARICFSGGSPESHLTAGEATVFNTLFFNCLHKDLPQGPSIIRAYVSASMCTVKFMLAAT